MRQVLASAEWLKKASSASLRASPRPSWAALRTARATPGRLSLLGSMSCLDQPRLNGSRAWCMGSAARSCSEIPRPSKRSLARALRSRAARSATNRAASITASSKSRALPSATSASEPLLPSAQPTRPASPAATVDPPIPRARRGQRPAERRLPRLLRRIQSIRASLKLGRCSASKRLPPGTRSRLATRSSSENSIPIGTPLTKQKPSANSKKYAPLSIS